MILLALLMGITSANAVWMPDLKTSWQWQLSAPLKVPSQMIVGVTVYDIDGFDNPASTVDYLHMRGIKVICYISAGSWENWRADAAKFPAAAKGKNLGGWAGEKWLDIRNAQVRELMKARMDMCVQKGFDAIEPDNIDGFENASGFPLTAADQLDYNRFLADEAHARGLSIGLKNDVGQIDELVWYFDWALNEECFRYNECSGLSTFVNAGKAVFQVEYQGQMSVFCPKANALNFNTLKKKLNLGMAREACR